jgi:hypothetical protein
MRRVVRVQLQGNHDNRDQFFERQRERLRQVQSLISFENKQLMLNRMFLVYTSHLSEESNIPVQPDCLTEFHTRESHRQEMRLPFGLQIAHVEQMMNEYITRRIHHNDN